MTRYITDAHCALPAGWLSQHAVAIVPSVLRFGDAELIDRRNEAECAAFAERLRHERRPAVRQAALSWAALATHLRCCTGDDSSPHLAIVADVWGVAPPVAWRRVLPASCAGRTCAVITCSRAGTAQALVLADAVRSTTAAFHAVDAVASTPRPLRTRLRTLLVPGGGGEPLANALAPLRRAGSSDGEVVNRLLRKAALVELHAGKFRLQRWFGAARDARARALALACDAVQKGLDPPVVVLSYAGGLASVADGDAGGEASGEAYANLLRTCAEHGTACLASCMPMAQSLRFGAGALELSFAARARGHRSSRGVAGGG